MYDFLKSAWSMDYCKRIIACSLLSILRKFWLLCDLKSNWVIIFYFMLLLYVHDWITEPARLHIQSPASIGSSRTWLYYNLSVGSVIYHYSRRIRQEIYKARSCDNRTNHLSMDFDHSRSPRVSLNILRLGPAGQKWDRLLRAHTPRASKLSSINDRLLASQWLYKYHPNLEDLSPRVSFLLENSNSAVTGVSPEWWINPPSNRPSHVSLS